jgi:transposase
LTTDLKERLVRAVVDGQPLREAARRFEVAVTTVKRAVAQQCSPGCKRRPNATVLERCAWWTEHQRQQVREATIWRAMRRLHWAHNKLPGSERA